LHNIISRHDQVTSLSVLQDNEQCIPCHLKGFLYVVRV